MTSRDFDIASIEKKLNTSVENGLSRRRAAERLSRQKKRYGYTSLYLSGRARAYECFLGIFKNFVFDLLLFMTVLSLVFGKTEYGVCLAFTVIVLFLLSGTAELLSEIKRERLGIYSNPTSRVIREGKTYLCDCRNVAVGDVIELSEGDLLPCDARLISTYLDENEDFTVEQINISDGKLFSKRLVKTVEGGADTEDISKMPFILLAGSRVISGRARAVVLAVGENTYLGSCVGEGAFAPKNELPKSVSEASDRIRGMNVIFAAVALISLIVGLFTSGEKGAADIFLVALSALCAVFSLPVAALGRMIYSMRLEKSAQSGAVIKFYRAADLLCSLTDIFLVGNAGAFDGRFFVRGAFASGRAFKNINSDGDVLRMAEKVYTYILAADGSRYNFVMTEAFKDGLDEFVRASGVDRRKIQLRQKSLYYKEDAKGDFAYVCSETEEGCERICLTFNRDILSYCEKSSFEGEYREFEKTALDMGRRLLYVVSERDGIMTFDGMLAFEQSVAEDLTETRIKLEEKGIRTILLLEEEDGETLALIERAGFSHGVARASEFLREEKRITDGWGDYSAYLGFTLDEYSELLSHCQSKGGKAAVYAVEDRYYNLLCRADLSVSCDMINYGAKRYPDAMLERIPEEGRRFSSRCSQLTRMSCGVIVRRTEGLSGIFRAREEAKGALAGFALALFCTLFASSILASFAILSVLTGIFTVSAPVVILLSGETAFFAAWLFSSPSLRCEERQDEVFYKKYNAFSFVRSYLNVLISPLFAAVLYTAAIAVLAKMGFLNDLRGLSAVTASAAVLTVASEIVLVIRKHADKNGFDLYKKKRLPKNDVIAAVILAATVFVSFAVLPLFPLFREGYGFAGADVKSLVLLPIYGVLYTVCRLVVGKFIPSRKKTDI